MMRLGCIILAAAFAGCVTPASSFVCTTDQDCTGGGTCEPDTGFCSFADADCDSGRRYGDAAGSLSNTCVGDNPNPGTCNHDGVVDTGEECDDGNQDDTDGCVECKLAKCGDGHIRAGIEECDDGNTADGDACNSLCLNCTADASVVSGGHCYMRFDTPHDWNTAGLDCIAKGGYLASLESSAENDVVTALITTGTYWIGGGESTQNAGSFTWQDDNAMSLATYNDFLPPNPDGPGGECTSKLAGVATQSWVDESCATAKAYVCEREPWTIDPMTRHAYHRFGGLGRKLNYADAVTTCGGLGGGHLVSITAQAEEMTVIALAPGVSTFTSAWIGLNDIAVEGTYVWETGEPFAYTNWDTANGEPTGLNAPTEDCGTLRGGLWQDRDCTSTMFGRSYVCEIDK